MNKLIFEWHSLWAEFWLGIGGLLGWLYKRANLRVIKHVKRTKELKEEVQKKTQRLDEEAQKLREEIERLKQ